MEIEVRKTLNLAAAVRAVAEHVPSALTLAEMVGAYAVARLDNADQRLRKWTDSFGHESAWDIRSDMVETAARAMVAAGYKPASANRDLSALGTVYRWAAAQRLTPRGFRSPTLDVRRFPEGIRRVEITATELQTLLARALAVRDRRFGVFVALLIDTGARKSELLGRRWSEFDLDRMEINCPTTKNGVPRILHFRPETAGQIQRVFKSRRPDDMVFEGRVPGEPINYRAAWVKTVTEIRRADLHMHDIRHARAAALLRAGVTLGVAAQVLGHDPAVLARRYGHLETDALRRAQEQSWSSAS